MGSLLSRFVSNVEVSNSENEAAKCDLSVLFRKSKKAFKKIRRQPKRNP